MEGLIGSQAGMNQRIVLWMDCMKKIMLSENLKDKTDWEIALLTDVDEAAPAAQIEALTTRVYGILVGMLSTAMAAWVALDDDAGGGFTFDATVAITTAGTARAIEYIPAAATAGVEEWWPFIYPNGIAIVTDAMLTMDGVDGTNLAANNLCRAFVVYRTINTE